MSYFIGVDVGTGSVRAALFSASTGRAEKVAVRELTVYNDIAPEVFEQSSDEIWQACVHCVQEITNHVEDKSSIGGIGFDATCSLVAIGANDEPISVSLSGDKNRNVIMWLDHRASKEAELINSKNHNVLKYTGGKVSLEMEIPKLMWLKKHLPESYNSATKFFDLPDFLTWKATGSNTRSLCSLVCKWNYTTDWQKDYMASINLDDLVSDKIGLNTSAPGIPITGGLTNSDLGLKLGITVGTSMIDAHAGALGLLNCTNEHPSNVICIISGTSTCHMAVSQSPIFAPGIWGPYREALLPKYHLNEGGQSAAGKLIDFVIENHPAYGGAVKNAKSANLHVQSYLNQILQKLAAAQGKSSVDLLTQEIHVYPDFHGNRSPVANPNLKGMISGLTFQNDEENLALLYLATVQALSYGTRHIIETLVMSGYRPFESLLMCGGLTKNQLYVQQHSNVLQISVALSAEPEAVLLGAAILGGLTASPGLGQVYKPDMCTKSYHDRKYAVFKMMLANQLDYAKVMSFSE